MHYFVEYLRALRALRIVGIILGILLVMAIITRLTVHVDRPGMYLGDLEKSPTAHVTRTTLADGSVRTVVDDPVKRVHAVSIVHGRRFHLEITQPSRAHKSETDSFNAANLSVSDIDRKGGTEHIVVNTDEAGTVPIGFLFLISIVMGLIVASMLGGVLSKENDGHLDLAWTKPVSREGYAVTAFAVDVAAIIVSQLLCIAIGLLCILLFFIPSFSWEPNAAFHIGAAFLGPITWYAAITAWSASVKRGPGVVIGLGWLFGSIVPGIAAATAGIAQPLVVAIHAIAQGLTYLDPLAYLGYHGNGMQVSATIGSVPIQLGIADAALAALTIFYLALAVAQWRRVEA